MTRTEWNIKEPNLHSDSLEHGYWSGKAIIRVDGKKIFCRSGKLWDTGPLTTMILNTRLLSQ